MIYLTTFIVSFLKLARSLASVRHTHTYSHSFPPGYYNPHAHVFCDCDICRDEWGGMDFADIVGSDSDLYSDEDDDDDGLYSYDADDRYSSSFRLYTALLIIW